jgi:hypothetical protein
MRKPAKLPKPIGSSIKREVKMKKIFGTFTIVLILLVTTLLLFRPKSAEGTVTAVRVGPEDIKEVIYKVNIRTVTVELRREINGVSRLAFVDYNKLEALKLIELLTSVRVLIASVDPDRGYVFDFGFIRIAE